MSDLTAKERCKESVPIAGLAFYREKRCSRVAVKDGYCTQHHPDTIAKRREKSQQDYERRIASSPLSRLRGAMKEIERLQQRVAELDACLNQYQARFSLITNAWRSGNNEAVLDAIRKHITAKDCEEADRLLRLSQPPEDRHAYATKDDLFNAGATHAAYRIHYARALREIADFGKANSGCGFSCAKKAEKALEFIYRASETKTADVCDDCGARGGQHYSLCSKRALADMAPLCNHGRPADHCDACEEDIERSHSDSLIEKLESVTAPETSVRHPGIKFCASCGKPAPSTVDPDVRLVVYQCEHCGYSNDVTDAVLSESETPRHG